MSVVAEGAVLVENAKEAPSDVLASEGLCSEVHEDLLNSRHLVMT